MAAKKTTKKAKSSEAETRAITREIHRLFWRANFVDKFGVTVMYLTRVPALVLSEIFIPLAVAYGIQAVFARQFSQVNHYVWLILSLAAGYAVLWAIGGYAISRNGVIAAKYVQRTVFANYLNKDYAFFSNSYLGALSSQAIQLRSTFSEYCQIFMLYAPRQVVVVLVSIVVIGWNSPLLATITLACMGVTLSYTIAFSRWRLKIRRMLSEASSILAGKISDAIGHATTVKSFASEEYEQDQLEPSLNAWGTTQCKTWASSIPADVSQIIFAAATTAIVLVVTASLFRTHAVSLAVVVLVQLYVVKMIAATHDIAGLVKQYETVMGSAHAAVKTMLVPCEVTDDPKPQALPKAKDLSITFSDVSFQYPEADKGSYAVKNFDLTIHTGEKIGLVGYSGSGKTTLTNLLLRFMDVSSGEISLGGVNIQKLRQSDLRSAIAYVPQEPILFHRSIKENIAYGRPAATAKNINRAAELAFVDDFVQGLPKAYDTPVGERGVKLSGGQRQRVAIARAILKDAPILVLDEATSALDSQSEKLIQEALWNLMEGRTAVVIAHRLSTIQRMDRIIVMDKGEIAEQGTHAELLKARGIYAKLWEHQSGGYIVLDSSKDEKNV